METMELVRIALARVYWRHGVTEFTNRLWDMRETEESKMIIRF